MILIYTILILLSAFPLTLTIWRMYIASEIKKKGVRTDSVIINIRTIRTRPANAMDVLTLEYKDRNTGKSYNGRAIVEHLKYKVGDTMPVVYLPDRPSKYAIDTNKAYWAILIFTILIFIFVLFAVYKINEMVASGQM